MTTLSLIVAMDRNRVIGKNNELPWYLPSDLQFFKRTTMNKPLVMGRKTYQSIGRPLPGRQMIIVTRQRDLQAPGCTVVHSLDAALAAAKPAAEVIIGGGANLYEQTLEHAQQIYLTVVDTEISGGDAFFPVIDSVDWQPLWHKTWPADTRNAHGHSRSLLERR